MSCPRITKNKSGFGWFTKVSQYLICLVFSLIVLCPAQPLRAEQVIRFYTPGMSEADSRGFYYFNLLKLALNKTKEADGPYRIELSELSVPQSEAVQLLSKDSPEIDVLWTMTSAEREDKLNAIRIPLLKGLLGYRMLLIKEQDHNKFADITLPELKRLTAIQGADWPDTTILLANGYTVKKSVFYLKMFEQLADGRVDYFPRGVTEIWSEVQAHVEKKLIAEPNVMLYYRSPIYFFTSKSNTRLGDRIERGLKLAVADGSFDKFFTGFAAHRQAVEQIKNAKAIHKLNNPSLSPLTPIEEKELWFTP